MNPNYYNILNVNEDAGDEEIKKSYHKLSLKYHPDRNKSPDASTIFQQINEAHEILSNKSKRTMYDIERRGVPFLQGLQGFGGMPMNIPGGFAVFHSSEEEDADLDDMFKIFGQLSGMGAGLHGLMGNKREKTMHKKTNNFNSMMHDLMSNMNKPPMIVKSLELSLEQIYKGGEYEIEFNRYVISYGFKTEETKTITVSIEPGIEDGKIITLKNEGNMLSSQQIGDVKIEIFCKPNELFERDGNDLIYKKNLSLKESLCGFNFEMNHINGREITFNNKKNPVVIKPGCRKEIPNMGMKTQEGTVGKMIVEFDIIFPDNLSEDQISSLGSIL